MSEDVRAAGTTCCPPAACYTLNADDRWLSSEHQQQEGEH